MKIFSPSDKLISLFEIDYYYVIELHQNLVGCGGINFSEDKRIAKLSWDIIHPAYQGKSLDTLLFQHRMAQLKKLKHIEQITVRTSQHAFQFYQKLGFKLIEIVPNYWAQGFDLYAMQYAL